MATSSSYYHPNRSKYRASASTNYGPYPHIFKPVFSFIVSTIS